MKAIRIPLLAAAALLAAGCGSEVNNLVGTWRYHTLGATVTLTFSRIELHERLLVTNPDDIETASTFVYRIERRWGDTLTLRVEPTAGTGVRLDLAGPQTWTVRFLDGDTVEITRPKASRWQPSVAQFKRIL